MVLPSISTLLVWSESSTLPSPDFQRKLRFFISSPKGRNKNQALDAPDFWTTPPVSNTHDTLGECGYNFSRSLREKFVYAIPHSAPTTKTRPSRPCLYFFTPDESQCIHFLLQN